MRRYKEPIYTSKYKKYNYPGASIIYTGCSYNTACYALSKDFMFDEEKIKIKKLNTDIFLVETKTHKFIIDEFAEYDNNLGIVVMC